MPPLPWAPRAQPDRTLRDVEPGRSFKRPFAEWAQLIAVPVSHATVQAVSMFMQVAGVLILYLLVIALMSWGAGLWGWAKSNDTKYTDANQANDCAPGHECNCEVRDGVARQGAVPDTTPGQQSNAE